MHFIRRKCNCNPLRLVIHDRLSVAKTIVVSFKSTIHEVYLELNKNFISMHGKSKSAPDIYKYRN